MNGFAHRVRAEIDDLRCLADDIEKGRCGVSLADAPHPHVVIDLDGTGSPLGPTQAKCDFLFFADPDLAVPVEIKGGVPNVARAARQLQAGADAAHKLAPRDLAVRFRPVLVSKSMRRQKQMELRHKRVLFRGRQEKIRRVPCGAPLTEALGNA